MQRGSATALELNNPDHQISLGLSSFPLFSQWRDLYPTPLLDLAIPLHRDVGFSPLFVNLATRFDPNPTSSLFLSSLATLFQLRRSQALSFRNCLYRWSYHHRCVSARFRLSNRKSRRVESLSSLTPPSSFPLPSGKPLMAKSADTFGRAGGSLLLDFWPFFGVFTVGSTRR